MNPIFIPRKALTIVNQNIKHEELALYFSRNKSLTVFVEDSFGNLVGQISHNDFKDAYNTHDLPIKKFMTLIEKSDLWKYDIQRLIIQDQAVPVLDNGVLCGALIMDFPEELRSFDRLMNQIALCVLPVFKQEIISYLKMIGVDTLVLNAPNTDFDYIKNEFEGVLKICNNVSVSDNSIIVDTIYSKSYRRKRFDKKCLSLEDLLTLAIIPVVKSFLTDNKIKFYLFEGPIAEKICEIENRTSVENSFSSAVANTEYLDKFSCSNNEIKEYLLSNDDGNSVITNGICLVMVIPNRGENVFDSVPSIHIYGPCITYGSCVPCKYSIPSLLKDMFAMITDLQVINQGVKNGHSLLNDFLYILSTRFSEGDVVVIINAFPEIVTDELEKYFKIHHLSEVFNNNKDSEWFFLDNTFHTNQKANQLIADEIYNHLIPFGKQKKKSAKRPNYFESGNRLAQINMSSVFENGLLASYREYLISNKVFSGLNKVIGSVILTANPLTNGHLHLIRYAKSKCDILYVFIVEENSFFLSTTERMLLVETTIKDPDIVVLATGNLMTCRLSFPEYFSKEKCDIHITEHDIPELHCAIFGKFVCPTLGITKRFLGEEMPGSVTDAYNNKLIRLMPQYGIQVEIIPRLRVEGEIVSSSKVRDVIKNRDYPSLKKYVPIYVEEYILKKFNGMDQFFE